VVAQVVESTWLCWKVLSSNLAYVISVIF